MLFGSDWLANLYLGCFLFGLIFTVVSLFLSAGHFGGADVHGHGGGIHAAHGHDIHLGGSHDAPGHGHIHTDVHIEGSHADDGAQHGFGWLNMPTILAFLTWFGGAGYLLHSSAGLPGVVSAAGAGGAGFIGATIIFLLLAKVLWPGQGRPLSRMDYQLRGTRARVASRISANGGTGEIVYVKGGVRSTLGARSDNGAAIEQGTEVVVMHYERGIAYVASVDAILNGNLAAELPPEHPTLPLRDALPPPPEKARS